MFFDNDKISYPPPKGWTTKNEGRSTRSDSFGKIHSTFSTLSELGKTLLTLRAKPTFLDKLSIGFSTLSSGYHLYANLFANRQAEPRAAFEYLDSPWRLVGSDLCFAAFDGEKVTGKLVEGSEVKEYGRITAAAYVGVLEDFEVGWVGSPGQNRIPRMYVKDVQALREFTSRKLWKLVPDKMGYMSRDGRLSDVSLDAVIETEQLRTIRDRCLRFKHSKRVRALMLDGPPGTGKSTAALWVAQQLGLTAVVVDSTIVVEAARSRSDSNSFDDDEPSTDVSPLGKVELMRPDVVVINDLDRVRPYDQREFLDELERIRRWTKIIFITTNDMSRLIKAVKRPGRIDDIFTVPGLGAKEVGKFFPELPDLHEKMEGWPIAYVLEMKARWEALGPEALEEFQLIAARVEDDKNPDDDDDDDDD